MHLIESYFGISPDGGDGSFEMMALVLLVVIGATIGMYLPLDKKRKSASGSERQS